MRKTIANNKALNLVRQNLGFYGQKGRKYTSPRSTWIVIFELRKYVQSKIHV